MARGTLRGGLGGGFHWAAAVLAAGLWAGAVLPARAQFFPFFGQPAPQRPQTREEIAPQPLTHRQVRAVLAREGARMVGQPRLRGQDIVAIGRDQEGNRKRFTLDAVSGEVLDVTVIARREAPPAPAGADLAPPGQPLSAPQHARDGAPPEAKAASPAPAGAPSPRAGGSDDSALSPIRPLRPRGAPKVEPMPQQ
jgi:hypothetical protein